VLGYNPFVDFSQKAAARLREFLATTGGERGGWDEDHHTLYLHLRSKLDRYHLVDALAQALPGKMNDFLFGGLSRDQAIFFLLLTV
jgi:hypothetical protein